MSAIEEMLCLLDERGMEYTLIPEDMYGSREYIKIGATEIRTNGCDEIAVYFLTPEQAVEAASGNLVRCEDCAYRRRSWNGHTPNFTDHFFCAYTGGHEVEPAGFCAWGERK